MFAPAGTPKSVVDLVNRKANAVLASGRAKESFDKLGVETVGGSPDVLAQRVQTEIQKWAGIVREKGTRLDQ